MAIYKSQALDRIFRALGDGTRREMLVMLAKRGELSAGQLAAPFALSQPTASKHIKVLEQSALIQRTIAGRTHYFRLDGKVLAEAESWIGRHRAFWSGSLDRLRQYAKTER